MAPPNPVTHPHQNNNDKMGMMPPPSRPPPSSTQHNAGNNSGRSQQMLPPSTVPRNRFHHRPPNKSHQEKNASKRLFRNFHRNQPPVPNSHHPNHTQNKRARFTHPESRPSDASSLKPEPTTGRSTTLSDLHSNGESALVDSHNDETHIIFAIDASGSMKTRDVHKTLPKGRRIRVSRWDAVFDCIKIFLQEQVKQNEDKQDNNNSGTCVVSLLIFNDRAQRLFHRLPLVDNGESIIAAVDEAHQTSHPHHGTDFSAGFREARAVAAANSVGGNVVLTFLSDGRPGDLRSKPPEDKTVPMQTEFRKNKKVYPAAGEHLEQMKKDIGDRFSLHLVCIFDEGRPWLEYLAKRYQGTFHNAELSMDEVGVSQANTGLGRFEEEHEDDILEMQVKSQSTVIREKFSRAATAGNVISIHGTTTSSTMRSTFQTISSTVTAMRSKSSRLVERQGIILESPDKPSELVKFPATRMVLDKNHGKILVAQDEVVNGRKVSIASQPFAQGGLRNVYRMIEEKDGNRHMYLVGKESRHEVKYQDRLKFHCETSSCQAQASKYANAFNFALMTARKTSSKVKVLRAEVYRLKDPSVSGNYRYMAVEEHLKGKYEKYNSNNGYVHPSKESHVLVAQAFSHFSYHYSNQEEMVVDIQGSCFTYTDPQLHSKTKRYGRADRGSNGFHDFFKTHKCNEFCRALGLSNCTIAPHVKPEPN